MPTFLRFFGLLLLLFGLLGASASRHVVLAQIIVNSTADTETSGDGDCTLREALGNANGDTEATGGDCDPGTGSDTISFDIDTSTDPGCAGSLCTIQPLTPLPTITDEVTIDGATQPGNADVCTMPISGRPPYAIILDGGGTVSDGLVLDIGSDFSVIAGLNIRGFTDDGIEIAGSSNHRIACNFIGTDETGSADRGNGDAGIEIDDGSFVFIGGSVPEEGNLISGNDQFQVHITGGDATSNTVSSNYIGTNAAGDMRLDATSPAGVVIDDGASDNFVGEVALEAAAKTVGPPSPCGFGCNVIAGNDTNVTLASSNNVVSRNYIGTNTAGTAVLPGQSVGVSVAGTIASPAMDNLIGSMAFGGGEEGNLISGHTVANIAISGDDSDGTRIGGNYIGTDITGTIALGAGTGVGVLISGGADDSGVGQPEMPAVGAAKTADPPLSCSGGCNVISGNPDAGVLLTGAGTMGNFVQGNFIGTTAAGSAALPNGGDGVRIDSGATNNTVGGTMSGVDDGNLISGNGLSGVAIDGVGTSGNDVVSNFIGTDAGGSLAVANTANGVSISGDATNNTVGGTDPANESNTIAFNGADGVVVTGAGSTGNTVQGNAIFENGQLGIDLGNDGATGNDPNDDDASPNKLQNFPDFRAFIDGGNLMLVYEVDTTPTTNATYPLAIEFFMADAADEEGEMLIGMDSYAMGDFPGTKTLNLGAIASLGDRIVATATDDDGNTSEFSAPVTVVSCLLTVTTTADAGVGSLRDAIDCANTEPGLDTIDFNITGASPHTIEPFSPLPTITEGVIIDGTTEPGYAGTPVVELDGNLAGVAANGLTITSSGSTVRALAINQFDASGVSLSGGGATGNVVESSFIGTDVTGTLDLGNTIGVLIEGGASDNIVGVAPSPAAAAKTGAPPMTCSGACNLISGNISGVLLTGTGTTGNTVSGNYIGTDASGGSAVANGEGVGIFGASANTIGGTATGAGNLISGNASTGLTISNPTSTGNLVQGNYIGTDAAGATALANGASGVTLQAGVSDNIVGVAPSPAAAAKTGAPPATCSGACNLISGNDAFGVFIQNADTDGNTISGNYIGTDAAGATAVANGESGVLIGDEASDNTIGGTAAGAGNLISGNANHGVVLDTGNTTGNLVQGNYIGTNATGTAQLDNTDIGVLIQNGASDNIIGVAPAPGAAAKTGAPPATCTGACNVISGNGEDGIELNGSGTTGNIVAGNYIGTNAAGDSDIANDQNGIDIESEASDNLIGGTDAGAGNLISGNDDDGVEIEDSGTMGNLVQGNYIGTDITGASDLPNDSDGVHIENEATNNIVGVAPPMPGAAAKTGAPPATCTGACNLISGNAEDGVFIEGSDTAGNVVSGNYIGTNAAGNAAVANGIDGVGIADGATNNIVGGTETGAGNLISGNDFDGVYIVDEGTEDNLVQGNYIGTAINGTDALANGDDGVNIELDASDNIVGMAPSMPEAAAKTAAPPATCTGACNVISGNADDGVDLEQTDGNVIAGNYVGTDASGTAALPNASDGFDLVDASDNTIGGTAAGEGNLISGNTGDGIDIQGASSGNIIVGNFIGTDATGADASLGNEDGIDIEGCDCGPDPIDNTIGGTATSAGNTIAFNVQNGVEIDVSDPTGNAILSNSIFENGLFGIDLGNDGPTVNDPGDGDGSPNNLQNFPEMTTFVIDGGGNLFITYKVDSDLANAVYDLRVEFFLADADDEEGQTFLGFDTYTDTDFPGTKTVNLGTMASLGDMIVATATDDEGNTSEFSPPMAVVSCLTVTTTADAGFGSLREAINCANANPGLETISFDLAGAGPHVITPLSELPDITDPVIIDGASEPDDPGVCSTPIATRPAYLIVLDGGGGAFHGLTFLAGSDGSTIRGLNIRNFDDQGIRITGSGGHTIECNFIGTDEDGDADAGNTSFGINIFGTSTNNTIGTDSDGTNDANEGNLISGNDSNGVRLSGAGVTDNVVAGNYIGTTAAGTNALGNSTHGLNIGGSSSDNTVGGVPSPEAAAKAGAPPAACTGACNLISGNGDHGVTLSTSNTSGNLVQGNYIGTNAAGDDAVPNTNDGVVLGGTSNTVGGTAAGAGNLLSGNGRYGIRPVGTTNMVQGNFIGINAAGTAALPNVDDGVQLVGGTGNIIGGATAGARNVISGNGRHGLLVAVANGPHTIQGNYIGTNPAGDAAIANGSSGVHIQVNSNNMQIGGPNPGEGNLISGNTFHGIFVGFSSTGATIEGNTIGTNAAGTAALPNSFIGVFIDSGADGTQVGGTASGAGNLISGNTQRGIEIQSSDGTVIEGNTIGTNAAGTAAIANGFQGIAIFDDADDTQIGGTANGAGNLLSGNDADGVLLNGADIDGTVIEGNTVGTTAAGTAALGNGEHGVEVIDALGTRIGGAAAGARNVISGNTDVGVLISSTTPEVTPRVGEPAADSLYARISTEAQGHEHLPASYLVYDEDTGAVHEVTAEEILARTAEKGGEPRATQGATDTIVQGNYIGTNTAGTAALGNGEDGVQIVSASNNLIGGTASGEGNLISGNAGDGVDISNSNATGNRVEGNLIGTNAAGDAALPNDADGVEIFFAAGNTIGGTASGAGNVISGNAGRGVELFGQGATGNSIEGNFIGTDAAGNAALGNGASGVVLTAAPGNAIGGAASGAGNVISGNTGSGVVIQAVDANDNLVEGNLIGTTATGTTALANSEHGVSITGGSLGNTVGGTDPGAGNTIAFNTLAGIVNFGDTSTGNAFLSNSIFENGDLGIDLNGDGVTPNDPGDADGSPNKFQNFPELSSASLSGGDLIVTYFVDSDPANQTYPLRVEFFFADVDGEEGQTLIGSDTYSAGDFAAGNKTVNLGPASSTVIVATATDDDGNTSEFSRMGAAILTATKTATVAVNNVGGPEADPGDVLEYTVVISNTGTGAAQDVAFDDTVDPNTTLDCGSVSSTEGSLDVCDDASLTVAVGTINAGDTVTITFRVTVNDPLPDDAVSIDNQGTVTATDHPPVVTEDPDDPDDPTTTPLSRADLAITKTLTSFTGGDDATTFVASFLLTVTNKGPSDATGVVVEDPLPEGAALLSESGGYNEATGLWSIGVLANGASATLTLTLGGADGNDVVNIARVDGAQPDPDLGNNLSGAQAQHGGPDPDRFVADLSLTKTVDNETPSPGSLVIYTLEVLNEGPSPTAGVRVQDRLPSGVEFVSATASTEAACSTCGYNDSLGVWIVGHVPVGKTATLEITARVTGTGAITNVAEVTTSTLPDPDSPHGNGASRDDDQDSAVITVSSASPSASSPSDTQAKATASEQEGGVPEVFALGSNYPNPFNPQTTIPYAVAEGSHVRLAVYDVLGREVARLVDASVSAGRYEAVWEAGDLPSGLYLVRLVAGSFVQTRRVTLLK